MLRPMPRACWKSSKRRVPRHAWRISRRFQWSPSTAALRAIVQGQSDVSVRFTAASVDERVARWNGVAYGPFHHGIERAEPHPHGEVRSEVVDDHILVMTVDRVAKKNAFTPKIMGELGAALTRLDDDPDLFVGVLTFAGEHTTAGLEMPLFFGTDDGPGAGRPTGADAPVDPFGLGRRLRKPLVTAVQGITFTIGIEIALAGDIVVAASDARFCQLEPKRGLAPLGGATIRYVQRAGWGNAMYHLLRADEFGAAEAHRIGLVQEVVEPGRAGRRGRSRSAASCCSARRRRSCTRSPTPAWPSTSDEPAAIAAIPAMAAAVQATDDFREGIASFVERRAGAVHRTLRGRIPWTSMPRRSTRCWRRPGPCAAASTSSVPSTTSCCSTASTSPSRRRPAATSAAGAGSSCATRRSRTSSASCTGRRRCRSCPAPPSGCAAPATPRRR